MSAPVVEAVGLGRRFGSVSALTAVDLVALAGESLVLFGPNGAGKTTLLRLLAGVLRPSGGTLRLFGAGDPGATERRRTGHVGHGSYLYGDLTAAENLSFWGEVYGISGRPARVAEALERSGLTPWRDRVVRSFSRGMEQRLALARAFLHDPDLLLLDEPFSGLDPEASAELAATLGRVRREGRTLIVTTHDLATGLAIADRAALVAGGRIVWQSSAGLPSAEEMGQIYEREVAAARAKAGRR